MFFPSVSVSGTALLFLCLSVHQSVFTITSVTFLSLPMLTLLFFAAFLLNVSLFNPTLAVYSSLSLSCIFLYSLSVLFSYHYCKSVHSVYDLYSLVNILNISAQKMECGIRSPVV